MIQHQEPVLTTHSQVGNIWRFERFMVPNSGGLARWLCHVQFVSKLHDLVGRTLACAAEVLRGSPLHGQLLPRPTDKRWPCWLAGHPRWASHRTNRVNTHRDVLWFSKTMKHTKNELKDWNKSNRRNTRLSVWFGIEIEEHDGRYIMYHTPETT